MRSKKVTLRTVRTYSEEFKKTQVKEYESGRLTIKEIGTLYSIPVAVIYRWVYAYSTYNQKKVRVVEMAESSTKKLKELHNRIQELERIVGQKQLNIDYLEKLIELAKTELNVDIKKNFQDLSSTGLPNTSEKRPTK